MRAREGAAPTFKMGYGFLPLGAWLANIAESLAMLLRPGNAGSNTFTDHLAVLTAAIRQIPSRFRSRLLVRVDGAGASHELIAHLLSLSSRCRTVLFTCGWAITEADEQAIGLLPAAWQAAVDQDGVVQDDKHVAEITHLTSRATGWPCGRRNGSRLSGRTSPSFAKSVLRDLAGLPGIDHGRSWFSRRKSADGLAGAVRAQARLAGEAAGLPHRGTGLGQETPEDMEVMRVHGEQLEPGIHTVPHGAIDQPGGVIQDGVPGGGLDQHRRQSGQVGVKRSDDRVVCRMPGEVVLGGHAPDPVQFGRQAIPVGRRYVDPRAQEQGGPGHPQTLMPEGEQEREDQSGPA